MLKYFLLCQASFWLELLQRMKHRVICWQKFRNQKPINHVQSHHDASYFSERQRKESQRKTRKVGIWMESMTNLKYTSLTLEILKSLASYWKYFQNVSEYVVNGILILSGIKQQEHIAEWRLPGCRICRSVKLKRINNWRPIRSCQLLFAKSCSRCSCSDSAGWWVSHNRPKAHQHLLKRFKNEKTFQKIHKEKLIISMWILPVGFSLM